MDFKDMIHRFPLQLVYSLESTPQNLKWHPEGCVMNHIRLVYELAQKVAPEDVDLHIAAIFHDLGKPQTTEKHPLTGELRSPGHERYAKWFIDTYSHLFPEAKDWNKIAFICKHHMKMHLFQQMRAFKREELYASPYFHSLVLFAFCDDNGRGKGADK